MVCGMLAGVFLLLYPSVANYWNSFHQTRAISEYSEVVSTMDRDDQKKIIESAREYNARLAETGMLWNMSESQRAAYNSELSVDGSNVMAVVSIPKFHIRCPIYHGTDESVLQIAVGHLECSSLPVGGEDTHTIVSGHRGLPSARLFTDIDKIKEGDTWTISVLNETLTYECDPIRIVLPDDLSTHRLLVRGHRVPNANGSAEVTADAIQTEPVFVALFLAVPVIILIVILFLISSRRARRLNPEESKRQYLRQKGLDK